MYPIKKEVQCVKIQSVRKIKEGDPITIDIDNTKITISVIESKTIKKRKKTHNANEKNPNLSNLKDER